MTNSNNSELTKIHGFHSEKKFHLTSIHINKTKDLNILVDNQLIIKQMTSSEEIKSPTHPIACKCNKSQIDGNLRISQD